MIVGTTNLNYDELKTYVNKPQELPAYCENLVPLWARHIEPIVLNQRYYVAINIRNMLSIPYKQRMEMLEPLLKGLTVKGVISSFTSIAEIINVCDKKALAHMVQLKMSDERQGAF